MVFAPRFEVVEGASEDGCLPARSPAGRDRGLCHAAARSVPRHVPLFGVNYFSAGKRSRIIGRGSGC